jgi:rhodanese-related sulfurtransferase
MARFIDMRDVPKEQMHVLALFACCFSDIEIPSAIPGAFRIDPSRLRDSPRISVPDDVEIVLYCSSRSEIVSAQAALALRRIGVENVWILEGGMHSWRDKGLPLSQFPEAPEAVAERLGVTLPDA